MSIHIDRTHNPPIWRRQWQTSLVQSRSFLQQIKQLLSSPGGRRIVILLLLTSILLPIAASTLVHMNTHPWRYTDPAALPPQRVAIVFGAGVRPNGQPSRVLADRIRAAVQLYQAGQVQKLLMTGDNSRADYNEVGVMERYAVGLGVPATDITLDYAGFSTYESCYRAQAIFGVQQAILITQQFHLPRAVYTCRQLGITAVGLGTPDWERYGSVIVTQYIMRESLATLKALWQVHVTRPQPTFLGPFEGIQ